MCAMRKSKVNKCKCCYSALGVGPSHLIFDEAGKRQNIAFLLFDYIGRTVYESNGDQQAVCDNCLRQLVQSFEFKQRCLRTVGSDDSDDEEEEEIVEEYNETVDDNLTLNEFDQYVEFIDDCGEQADGDEDEEVDGDGTSAEHMVDGAEYEYLNEAIEFEPVKEELQSLTTSEVEYLDPELDDDDDGNYTNANVEESAARERDIIELTEYALDTTSKTVKTIGKLNLLQVECHECSRHFDRIFEFTSCRYNRGFASSQRAAETRHSTAHGARRRGRLQNPQDAVVRTNRILGRRG